MMNTENNTVIASVVEAHNKAATEEILQAGVRLTRQMEDEKKKIAGCEERIKAAQEELGKVSADVIDEARIFGGSVPQNANRDTIAAVIEKANKDRQYEIEQRTAEQKNRILAEQNAIAAIQGRIARFREEILKLTPVTITVEQVVG